MNASGYRREILYRCRYRYRYYINTGTGHFGTFGETWIPVPDTYNHKFGKFGTIWIPVPPVPVQTFIRVADASVSWVQHHNTGTGHFGKLVQPQYRSLVPVWTAVTNSVPVSVQTSIPVRDTSMSPVHQPRTGHFGKFGTSTRYFHIVA